MKLCTANTPGKFCKNITNCHQSNKAYIQFKAMSNYPDKESRDQYIRHVRVKLYHL